MYRCYCRTLYFCCILISRFWKVEISLHFNLSFTQCSTSIFQAFDGQTEFSRVFNFTILSYSRNSRKFDACGKLSVLQYYCYETLKNSITRNIKTHASIIGFMAFTSLSCLTHSVQLGSVRTHLLYVRIQLENFLVSPFNE